MVPSTCRFCERSNPADAKFCSECGGSLSLLPCPRCGAVSDITASKCYQCGNELAGRKAEESLEPPSTAPAVAESLPRRHSRVIVGTTILAAFAVLGYYIYHQRALVDASKPSTASGEPHGQAGSANAGIIRQNATALDTTPAKTGNGARQPAESREAKAAAAPVARTPAIEGNNANERVPSSPEACTEAVTTLGLCATKPVQKKETQTTAAAKAAIARPQAIDPGKASKAEPPRQGACTEATTALGLCAPTPTVPAVTHTQRKE